MNISPTAVAQAYFFERKTGIASREESPFAVANARTGGDVSVSISAAGRQAAAIDMDALESYRLPDWMPSLMPGQVIDGAALDREMHAYWNRIGELEADGEFSAADRAEAKSLLDGLPVRKAMMADDEFRASHRSEIAEYGEIFRAAYDEAKREQGIATREDYVGKVLQSPGDNTALRDSVVEKLLANPRAVELMGVLGVARPAPAASPETHAYDTSGGTMDLDIDAYFSAGTNRAEASLRDLPPLLLPSQNNIDALASHISAKMPAFLADHGIPAAPERITYDSAGRMQLPADYPYAEQFKQALADDPVLERQLRTVNALSSHVAEMAKSLPFQQEYAAATTQAEVDAVVAKYAYLFSGTRQYDEIALLFAADGRLTVMNATQNVALSAAAG